MISNEVLQNTLEGLKNITRVDFLLFDPDGSEIAGTFDGVGQEADIVKGFVSSQADTQTVGNATLFKIINNQRIANILLVNGIGDNFNLVGRMAAFQIQNMLEAYEERFDKDNFVKNLLLDNLLLVDIYNRAKKLKIETGVKRTVFIAETDADSNVNVIDIIHDIFPDRNRDFVTAVDEKNTIIVKNISEIYEPSDLEDIAAGIVRGLEQAGVKNVRVSYGTVVGEIKEVSKSYKEAKMALDVGKIFFEEKNVVGYSRLGIGRLIYQLPISLCKMFIKEIFDGKNPDEFDEETVSTINKFFENSLNVSETSRQLYIHRNTLVYRIDKLEKATGLDLRVFDDAITFKIALMVGKYMKYMEKQDY